MTALTSTQLKAKLGNVLQAGLVPMIAGSPGIGKSDVVRAIAEQFNLYVIDHRLSTSDPTDKSGLPAVQGEKATFLPLIYSQQSIQKYQRLRRLPSVLG